MSARVNGKMVWAEQVADKAVARRAALRKEVLDRMSNSLGYFSQKNLPRRCDKAVKTPLLCAHELHTWYVPFLSRHRGLAGVPTS